MRFEKSNFFFFTDICYQTCFYLVHIFLEKKGGKFFFEQAEFVKLPIGEEINVLVVHIENPAEFYVIPQDDLLGRELEENEAKINDFCINNEGTAHDPEVAEIVLAKFEGLWYRALTIAEAAPKTSSYNLQFLDYGNYAVTSSKDIRRMEDQFMYLPFVACFLTLNEFEGRDPTAQETMEFKKRLQLNSPVKVKVLEFECARYTVDIPSLGF
ncbi:tudor domain-containing protein 1-like [Artemia franciscana]|uniref:tudor domain-containing protein 1-like n=1 Tax=Artemia franciscana TaxID=6661 RepID=UPI0032DB4CA7